MPRENRLIIFDYAEIYKAIYSLCVQKSMPRPPEGMITSITQDEKDTSVIYVDFSDPTETKAKRKEYSYDFIAASLMLYCRGLGIPLPKSAKKAVSFQEKDNEVTLHITVGTRKG